MQIILVLKIYPCKLSTHIFLKKYIPLQANIQVGVLILKEGVRTSDMEQLFFHVKGHGLIREIYL